MSFPRYPKYKASGVELFREVPEHWVICPPKRRIQSLAGGTLIKGACADEPSDDLFPGFSASGQNIWLEEYIYDCSAIVLSAVGARCGKAFKADGKWGVVANTHCLFPRAESNRDYLWYLTNQEDWWEKGGSAQPFVKVSETLARPWVFPPLPEQTVIAEFLDRETGKIDELVAEQRRLIELLKEKRQAVISHAVTKGLNPHVPMKPSGIEWLGDVPEHWAVVSLRYIFDIKAGGDLKEECFSAEKSEEYPYPIYTNSLKLNDVYGYTSRSYFKANTITVTGRGDIGYATYRDHEYDAIIRLLALTPKRNEQCKYYAYFINSVIKFLGGNTAVSQLSAEQISPYKVCSPTLPERQAIVAFLETELTKFDTLTAEAQRAIDLLQERRTALISAAVTGQIDVREVFR